LNCFVEEKFEFLVVLQDFQDAGPLMVPSRAHEALVMVCTKEKGAGLVLIIVPRKLDQTFVISRSSEEKIFWHG